MRACSVNRLRFTACAPVAVRVVARRDMSPPVVPVVCPLPAPAASWCGLRFAKISVLFRIGSPGLPRAMVVKRDLPFLRGPKEIRRPVLNPTTAPKTTYVCGFPERPERTVWAQSTHDLRQLCGGGRPCEGISSGVRFSPPYWSRKWAPLLKGQDTRSRSRAWTKHFSAG